MAQNVAERLRSRLGETEESLRIAESLNERSVPAQLIVTVHEDGNVTRTGVSETGDTTAIPLLREAFDEARARGGAMLLVPDSYSTRSVVVRLALEPGTFASSGALEPPSFPRSQFRVFLLPYPTMSPALPKKDNPSPRYPPRAELHDATGYLILRFIVDSSGSPEPSSIHDLWPTDKPRLTGDLGRYYDNFVQSVTETVRLWKFIPARVGACHVRQVVTMPIEFRSAGYTR